MSDYKYACGCKLLDSGGHFFGSIHEPSKAPTQQEQQAIDRALWSEIGLAIGRIEANLQKAEKSAEIASNRYYEAFQTEVRIEKALEGLALRQSAIEDSLKHLHGKFALLNSRVAPIAQPKRKRERKGKK